MLAGFNGAGMLLFLLNPMVLGLATSLLFPLAMRAGRTAIGNLV